MRINSNPFLCNVVKWSRHTLKILQSLKIQHPVLMGILHSVNVKIENQLC